MGGAVPGQPRARAADDACRAPGDARPPPREHHQPLDRRAFRGIPQHAVYSAFKAGVTQFTKSLALEVGTHGVRVNAIAPDLTQSLQVRYDEWVPEEQRRLVPVWVPVGRFGQPDDIAGVALFLASDLSGFVTGTTVHADGGSLAAGGWYRTERGGWTNRPLAP